MAQTFRMPEYHLLIYGDGHQAMVVGGLNIEFDQNGEELITFEIVPTMELENEYGIKPDEWTKAGTIFKRYYSVYHIVMNLTPTYGVHFLFCDYRGNADTPLVKYYDKLIEANRTLKRLYNEKKSAVAFLESELAKTELRVGERDRKTLERMEPVKKFAKSSSVYDVQPAEAVQGQGGEES